MTAGEARIQAIAERVAARGDSAPRAARDPVNLAMIRNWTEAIGGPAPGYPSSGDTAPPAMIQVWTMPGLHGLRGDDDPLGAMSRVLDEAGYTSVVATNCAQRYHRYLKIGEQLTVRTRLTEVTGPKRTGLGEGWFVTVRSTWCSEAAQEVAEMDFRVLKFRPGTARPAAASVGAAAEQQVMRPQITQDTEFFWRGTAEGELRIQRCSRCGTVRHPPGPMCPACHAPVNGEYVVAKGTGEVYSYVVHHHPPVPGKTLPIVIALVELPEGVRITGELRGIAPGQVRIGLPVQAEFTRIDDELTLAGWRPASQQRLPELAIDVTPTFVIASALATRDFQDVHHDRDLAVARGGKDIFLNILTSTGLVQRYVSDWAGPDATIKAIDLRLGVPCYAGDTLTFSGYADGGEVQVTGRCGLGDHVTATVDVERR
jgi:uncharacterized OB-fold protein